MNIQKQNYANLIIKKGINLQENQPVLITAPIETYEFIEILVEEAYKLGASQVIVDWINDVTTKLKYKYENIDNFKVIPNYIVDKNKYLIDNNFAYIKISATDPLALKDVDTNKIITMQKAYDKQLRFKTDVIMKDLASWCVVSVPTQKWAETIFPKELDPVNKLWEVILKIVRCDKSNYLKLWEDHIHNLNNYSQLLNDYNFDSLLFINELGTNLEVGLIKNHIWMAAESINNTLLNKFIANLPTEEVYTMPNRKIINGKVYSSKPLNYQGNLIDDFYLEFKEGKVINYDAKIGKDLLTKILNTDKGSNSLGEIALVSYNSPISQSNILFYNTLFDENASCHLALGQAYPTNFKDYQKYNEDQLYEIGVNNSCIHIDFMFGTEDLKLIGKKDNEEIIIFQNGNFII